MERIRELLTEYIDTEGVSFRMIERDTGVSKTSLKRIQNNDVGLSREKTDSLLNYIGANKFEHFREVATKSIFSLEKETERVISNTDLVDTKLTFIDRYMLIAIYKKRYKLDYADIANDLGLEELQVINSINKLLDTVIIDVDDRGYLYHLWSNANTFSPEKMEICPKEDIKTQKELIKHSKFNLLGSRMVYNKSSIVITSTKRLDKTKKIARVLLFDLVRGLIGPVKKNSKVFYLFPNITPIGKGGKFGKR